MSIGASMRWVLACRRLVIVAWLLVAVVGLARCRQGDQRAVPAVGVVSAVRP